MYNKEETLNDNGFLIRKAVYLHNINHVKQAATVSGVQSIYLDYKLLYECTDEELKICVSYCALREIDVYVVLPHILKADKYDKFKSFVRRLRMWYSRFVCRNIEQIGFLGSEQLEKII